MNGDPFFDSASKFESAGSVQDLVPGDPAAMLRDVEMLDGRLTMLEEVLVTIDGLEVSRWEGETAYAFMNQIAATRQKVLIAATEVAAASRALALHAGVLAWAQERAAACLVLWQQGAMQCVPNEAGPFQPATRPPEQERAIADLDVAHAAVRDSANATAKVLEDGYNNGPGSRDVWWRPFAQNVVGQGDNPWHWREETLLDLGIAMWMGVRGARGPVSTMQLGKARSKDFKGTFFGAHPGLRGKVVVHHAIEQNVLKRYPGLFTEAELHSLANLRGIPNAFNNRVHLSAIRRAWDRFYETHPAGVATKEDFLEYARKIDIEFGGTFEPPL